MREIKFRAWNKLHNAYWGVVTQFVFENAPQMVYQYETMGWDGSTEWHNGEDAIFEQFTGLHDKNGKEIYEGDICRFPSGLERTISFAQGGFGYIASGEFIGFAGHGYLQEIVSGCEVIGNIHENTELING